ncbi:hypothetical protein [Alicyclobacillus herbarius]|uniref:hypothetical protein n=1 Tax=Alicyclobacillus herbarius TaxID=122960 RepID=UPI000424A126|nr:hypothetical protein [Alicyclobacillus herbarius]
MRHRIRSMFSIFAEAEPADCRRPFLLDADNPMRRWSLVASGAPAPLPGNL